MCTGAVSYWSLAYNFLLVTYNLTQYWCTHVHRSGPLLVTYLCLAHNSRMCLCTHVNRRGSLLVTYNSPLYWSCTPVHTNEFFRSLINSHSIDAHDCTVVVPYWSLITPRCIDAHMCTGVVSYWSLTYDLLITPVCVYAQVCTGVAPYWSLTDNSPLYWCTHVHMSGSLLITYL